MAYSRFLTHDSADEEARRAIAARLEAMFGRFDRENTAMPEDTEQIVVEARRHRKAAYRKRD